MITVNKLLNLKIPQFQQILLLLIFLLTFSFILEVKVLNNLLNLIYEKSILSLYKIPNSDGNYL